eukprot:11272600-Heterocapsa_arctica.AAC.1
MNIALKEAMSPSCLAIAAQGCEARWASITAGLWTTAKLLLVNLSASLLQSAHGRGSTSGSGSG